MNKKSRVFFAVTIIGFLLLFSYVWATKFYKPPVCRKLENLTPEQVERISVYSYRLERAELTQEEAAKIITLFHKMDIRGVGSTDYLNYDGAFTNFMFYIEMKDGTNIIYATSAPHYIINGLGYEADYDVSHEIQDLYNCYRKEKFKK